MNPSLEFLYSLQSFGMKLGLRNIEALLEFLGNPQKEFPCIHIAGTNGKGSTSSMIASVVTASGYKTGLYTSPHLISFYERIKIDGKPIAGRDVIKYTNLLKQAILEYKATFFEATTAIAFQYFADCNVDIAVIETGLGGRFDATNVLTPVVSVITNIGFDHTEQLGTTLPQIAFEKGGIIKAQTPCITGVKDSGALQVLQGIANAKNSALIETATATTAMVKKNLLGGIVLDIATPQKKYHNLQLSLPGDHQVQNLSLSLLALESLQSIPKFKKITEQSIKKGLKNVQSLAGFHARLEIVDTNPLTIIDVGHNPDGIRTAFASLRHALVNKPLVIFGVMKDKDYLQMIEIIAQHARVVIAVQPETERALFSKDIVDGFHRLGFPAIDGKSVRGGILKAKEYVRSDEAIVVIGSHYVAGEALQGYQRR